MAPLAKLGFLGWAVIAGAGTIAGVLVVGALYQSERTVDMAEPAPEPAPGPTPEPTPAPAPGDTPTAAPDRDRAEVPADDPAAPDALPAVTPPGFDVVRIARDGAALVAGTAAPGAGVTLRVDGEQAAQAAADGAGEFVVLFSLAPTDELQMLTLEMVMGDGRVIPSPDSVVLTPRPTPPEPDAIPELALEAAQPPPSPLAAAAPPDAAPVMPGPLAALPEGDEPLRGTDMPPIAALPPRDAAPAAPAAPPDAEPVAEAPVRSAPLAEPGAETATAPEVEPEATPESEPEAEIALPAPTPDTVAPEPAPDIAAAQSDPAAPDIPGAPAIATEPVPRIARPEASDPAPDLPALPQQPEAQIAAAPPAPESAEPSAEDLPRAFLLRGTGEVTLLDRAPQVMDNVVIDMIGYGAEGDVRISGRAARADPEGRVRLYLDNQPIALAQAEEGDWRLDLPDIDPGVYTLRVDQLGAGGEVVSRFETPFQREAPELVARAQVEAAPVVPAPDAAAEPVEAQPPRPEVALITVQPGHSLWRISTEHYGEGMQWVQIYRANRGQIRNPDLIYPGQVFTLPD